MSSTSSYYDIDDILAEEELVPCTTLFEFSHLSFLDPDVADLQHSLPESSRCKVPLWAVEKWAMLGFVRIALPRHFTRKARERLEADPSEVDLRYVLGAYPSCSFTLDDCCVSSQLTDSPASSCPKISFPFDSRRRNERFFLSGRMMVDLIEQSSKKVAKAIATQSGGRNNMRRNQQILALENVLKEARELRRTLISVRFVLVLSDRRFHSLKHGDKIRCRPHRIFFFFALCLWKRRTRATDCGRLWIGR